MLLASSFIAPQPHPSLLSCWRGGRRRGEDSIILGEHDRHDARREGGIGGILGTVVEARDTDVLLKVDESSNTKIRFSRNAIHRVVDEDKTADSK